jgi:hypothetical protein
MSWVAEIPVGFFFFTEGKIIGKKFKDTHEILFIVPTDANNYKIVEMLKHLKL